MSMEIICLFLQRTERYEGEYAPELLAAVDCFTNDENPAWFEEQCKAELDKISESEIAGTAIVTVKVSHDKIRAMCLQSDHKINGEIKD